MNHLHERYIKEILPKLKVDFNESNLLALPRICKITVNMGIGRFKGDKSYKDQAQMDLQNITGQKPAIRKSKKAISSFKLRAGEDVGLVVTLRGKRMWDFLQNLIMTVLPRIRDFRGVSPSCFDGSGNYSLGIREHIVFPTVDVSKIDKIKSLQITINTTTKDDKKAKSLLESLGLPFIRFGKDIQ
jgi:large subunit ribosomal protein L5